MITSRNMIVSDEPKYKHNTPVKPTPQPEADHKPTVKIERKFNTPFGSVNTNLILDAIDVSTGEVVKTKTYRIYSFEVRKSSAKVITCTHEFTDELRKEGFKINDQRGND